MSGSATPWGGTAAKAPRQPDGFADFADGTGAALKRVGLRLYPAMAPDRLLLTLPDGRELAWPLEDLRRLPDQAHEDSLVLTSAADPLARLYLNDPRLAGRIGAHVPADSLWSGPRPPLARILKWGLGAVASVALIIFLLVPVMADQLARFLPAEGERALGDATFEQIRRVLDDTGTPLAICELPAGVAAVDAMVARLNPRFDDLPYPVRVSVLDHDLLNAFTLPGGRIILFRGLIDAAESPDEVAGVLAHEIGHAVNRDPTRDALRSAGSIGVLGLLFGDFAGGTAVLFLANSLINARYSQQAEAAADAYAHDLMRAAGLSPAALGTMFVRLREQYGEASGLVAHFAAHPALSQRIEASLAAARDIAPGPPALNADQWQDMRGICGGSLAARLGRILGK